MHAAAAMNPAFAVEDVRFTPERLYLRIDLDMAVAELPEDLGTFYAAFVQTGDLRAAAQALGLSAVEARKRRHRIKALFIEAGLGMDRGP